MVQHMKARCKGVKVGSEAKSKTYPKWQGENSKEDVCREGREARK